MGDSLSHLDDLLTRTIQPLYKYVETENCGLRLPICVISSTSTAHARMQCNALQVEWCV